MSPYVSRMKGLSSLPAYRIPRGPPGPAASIVPEKTANWTVTKFLPTHPPSSAASVGSFWPAKENDVPGKRKALKTGERGSLVNRLRLNPASDQVGLIMIRAPTPAAGSEIDGGFVGSTPTTLEIAAGMHHVSVKSGAKGWQRTLQVTAGSSISLNANLQ